MKKLLTFLLLVTFCTTAYAQVPNPNGQRNGIIPVKSKNHMFYLGVKGGANLSTMTQPDECDLYDSMGLGYHGGLVLQARFNKATPNAAPGTGLLGVGLEAKYKLNSVKTTAFNESGKANANFDLTYVDVPVYAHIYPFYKTRNMNNFYIEVGPDFAFLMDRKPKTLTVNSPQGNVGSVTYNLDTENSTLKGMDIRVMAGLGYDFAIKNENFEATNLIGINARYYLGMNKLAGNFNSKMSTIEVSLSWLFNIGKL